MCNILPNLVCFPNDCVWLKKKTILILTEH